jgi:hypothetical protein
MQLVGMVLGGLMGLLFFGEHSWGFYASVLVGALVGAALRQKENSSAVPPNSEPNDPEAIDAASGTAIPRMPASTVPAVSETAMSSNQPFKSVLVAVALMVIGLFVWMALRPEVHKEEAVVSDDVLERPNIDAEVWDSRHCLLTSFPQSQYMAVPPEVDMFCAQPWDQATMKKLRDALHQAGIGFADLLPKYPEIAAMIESIPHNELRDFALIERILPLAKADQATSEGLKSILLPATLDKIRAFKANVPWNEDPTEDGLRRYYLSDGITLVTDQFAIDTVAELADAVFIRITAPATINEAMGNNVAEMLNWRGVLESPASFMTLMFLQANVIFETMLASKASYETALATSIHDFEIYFTDALPDWPCNGQSLAGRRAALLCPKDRRLFVSVAPLEAVGDVYAEFAGRPVFKLPPAFFHELAHLFWDPINRESQPFLAEGSATAKGERSLQIFKAVVSKARDKATIEDMRQFFKGISDPNYKGPDVGSTVKIQQTISDQPFSVFQTAAVCYVAQTLLDAKPLMRQLEMPASFFNGQTPDELRHAYYFAWSLFHYGEEQALDVGGIRLDASMIRRVANLVMRNRPVEGQDLIALDTYLAQVHQLARADIEKRGLSCPSS